MTPTKLRILTLASLLTFALSPAFAASPFAGIDTDNDGTVDLNEAKAAASPEFDKLDVDHDGALDHKELDGRLSKKDWVTADPDKDGTLTKDEYLNTVETIFKQADKDGDGAVYAGGPGFDAPAKVNESDEVHGASMTSAGRAATAFAACAGLRITM